MTFSASPVPWKAPAMKGLSSTALQKTTSFAQPRPSRSAVAAAVSLIIRPIRATASMLIPARVDPTFTEEHTSSVRAKASGIERINFSSAAVIPFCTRAE